MTELDNFKTKFDEIIYDCSLNLSSKDIIDLLEYIKESCDDALEEEFSIVGTCDHDIPLTHKCKKCKK